MFCVTFQCGSKYSYTRIKDSFLRQLSEVSPEIAADMEGTFVWKDSDLRFFVIFHSSDSFEQLDNGFYFRLSPFSSADPCDAYSFALASFGCHVFRVSC